MRQSKNFRYLICCILLMLILINSGCIVVGSCIGVLIWGHHHCGPGNELYGFLLGCVGDGIIVGYAGFIKGGLVLAADICSLYIIGPLVSGPK